MKKEDFTPYSSDDQREKIWVFNNSDLEIGIKTSTEQELSENLINTLRSTHLNLNHLLKKSQEIIEHTTKLDFENFEHYGILIIGNQPETSIELLFTHNQDIYCTWKTAFSNEEKYHHLFFTREQG